MLNLQNLFILSSKMNMKQTFDYLENVPNIAATICDKEGIVLYQNKRASI